MRPTLFIGLAVFAGGNWLASIGSRLIVERERAVGWFISALAVIVVVIGLSLATAGCSGSSTAPSSTPAALPPNVTTTPLPTPAPAPVVRGPSFSQVFWNEFVHNGLEAPAALQPLRRLTAAPMLYLKTVDEAGNPIDFATLNTVQTAMRDVASIWGGGQFGLAGIQQGTGTMEGVHGWITVKWPSTNAGNFCGLSQVAVDGGWIELNYLFGGTCTCGASKIRPRTAKHELGHAFGYYHTDSDADVMKNPGLTCDANPSDREIYHASIAYQTPVGATDFRAGAAPIIVD